MKAAILILMVLFHNSFLLGQRTTYISFPENCNHIIANSYSCGWKIIARRGRVSGQIIEFTEEQGRCGIEYVAAVAIIKTKKDTLRVIIGCFRDTLKVGENIRIRITGMPNYDDVHIPVDELYFDEQEKIGNPIVRVNKYDATITKTVFGYLLKA